MVLTIRDNLIVLQSTIQGPNACLKYMFSIMYSTLCINGLGVGKE